MKKIILMGALLVGVFAQAQLIEVRDHNDELLPSGYVFETNELGTEAADFPLNVKNVTEGSLFIKLRMNSMVNAENMNPTEEGGTGVQFCFGTACYFEVEEGDMVPAQLSLAKIIGGGENPDGDHFVNDYAGDIVGNNVEYNMALVQFNADGTEAGELFTFTYRYVPLAGTTDFTSLKSLGINLKNTVVASTLDLSTEGPAKLEVIDLNGRTIRNFAITAGSQSIDLSGLSSAVYFARFTTEANKTAQVKIVKN